jgi:parvulin-like peptidyl-prolyl isomerase
MNKRLATFLVLVLSFPVFGEAQVRDNPELMAARGKGEVTHSNFEARANRIPPEMRFRVIRDRARMEDMLNKLLIDAQMAADAKEAGFHEDPLVQKRLELAVREELARAWIEYKVDADAPADYTTMAREEWMLNRDRYMTPETVDVAHILVGLDGRSDEEALELAESIKAQLDADPARFAELVWEHSDDSGSRSRGGEYRNVKRGDMVKPFEDTAFSLEVGQISGPVRTDYGYHIIRKDAVTAPQPQPFESIQASLEEQMREEHRERKRREYLKPLYEEELEVTQESVETAIERVFGPEVLARNAEDAETQ